MTRIFKQLLADRGLDKSFLHPKYEELFDPFLMQGMTKAVGAYVQGLEPFDDLTMIGLSYYGPEGRK
jgi:hypothetical protein